MEEKAKKKRLKSVNVCLGSGFHLIDKKQRWQYLINLYNYNLSRSRKNVNKPYLKIITFIITIIIIINIYR